MDDLRFDAWVRSLRGHRSRRAVVASLAGAGAALLTAHVAPPVAQARRGTAGPGDPCRHSDQCVAADAPLVCAWNGFGGDGDYNCCTYDGSRCRNDRGCCGYSICVGGWCASGGDGGSASAGSGGIANASANGGVVSIGDVNSGGNVGNVIGVGNTSGGLDIYGGNVADNTDVSVAASGGTAISDASGGSGNVAGG